MLSIVIPVYNEEESLEKLHQEICDVARDHEYDFEIIFVDDGSSDESWSVIERLAAGDSRIGGIRFRRNFGKAAALDAGFSRARGEIVMTLDADLQDDPKEIPRFLEKMETGLDVVSGWKKVRHDPWHKVFPSRVFNWMVSRLTGVMLHDHNCGMKSYRREIFDEVRLYGELHRFVPVLADGRGYKVGELVIEHRAREFGKSKYGLKRFIKGFLDLLTVKFLTGYGRRPQHVLGSVGLLLFVTGLILLTYLAGLWTISRILASMDPVQLHERPLLIYALGMLLMGGQLLSIGMVAELFIANHEPIQHEYSIKMQLEKGESTAVGDDDDDTGDDASSDDENVDANESETA